MAKILLLFVLITSGCVSTYNKKMVSVKADVKAANYKKALSNFEKTGIQNQERNSLLYHLEAGLLYHLAGNYEKSNQFLENAEWISDELYTKSISGEAASLVTSDNILPYRGETYEYLFTNYYKLLNYLYIGSLEDALVEVRRINHKLSLFKKDDAFMHYLTAMLYQHNIQDSDAFIEYKKAYNAYKKSKIKFPKQLSKDISVFCKESGFSRCKEFPKKILNTYSASREYSSVVFIVETGFIPNKSEERVEAAIPQNYRKKHAERFKDIYYLTVSLPKYTPLPDKIDRVSVNLNGKTYKIYMVDDIGAVAEMTLDEKKPKILAKAIARAVTKYIAYKSVKGKKPDALKRLLSTSVNVLGAATENADTRSWLMLPNRIFLSRQYLAPGEYSFSLNLKSQKGIRKTTGTETFTIKNGETKFIVLREFY